MRGSAYRHICAALLVIAFAFSVPVQATLGACMAFLDKGCVVCHSVNEVGGTVGPALNAADMLRPMNAFEFAARMWRGAPSMVQMQQDLLGEAISLRGQDLAGLVAFPHDEAEQRKLKTKQIPTRYRDLIVQ